MASDMYVKIDGIDGESTDAGHVGQIEIESYSIGVSQTGSTATSSAGGQTTGRASLSDFTFTKALDKSTPNLIKYCCSGKHIASVVVDLCGASEQKLTYMTYTMTDVVISAYSTGGGSGSRPNESVSLRFGTISWAYTPYDNTGKAGAAIKGGWNSEKNIAI